MIPVTIDEEIRSGSSKVLSHRKFNSELTVNYKKCGGVVHVPINPLISKYKDYFDRYIYDDPLTETEARRYRYAPKTFSLDMYGTTEYWSVILFLNDCHSITEFCPSHIKYVDPAVIAELFQEIFILEGKK